MVAQVKTVAPADAMFSLHTPSFTGSMAYPADMQWIFQTMNCSGSVNQACLAKHTRNGSVCMFGANTDRFVKTPLFVLNSMESC